MPNLRVRTLVSNTRGTFTTMTAAPRLFRVIMPATSVDDSARFYSALFDTTGFRVSNGRHYFDCGGVILAVYDAVADGDKSPVRSNAEHVYFAVADLAAVLTRAQNAGGLSTEIGDGKLPMGEIAKRPWGEVSFYMHDPAGNPICFVDEKSIFRAPR
jgi:predicted enzyme related to lactoylglutathione lyase